MEYRTTPLFGGAITVSLPPDYLDASTIRDVPSTQEVYLASGTSSSSHDASGDEKEDGTSIIIELLEYVVAPAYPCATDKQALLYHYEDMITTGYTSSASDVRDSGSVVSSGTIFEVPHLTAQEDDAEVGARALGLVAWRTTERKPDATALLVTLIRLPSVKTDVLMTVVADADVEDLQRGRLGKMVEKGEEIRKKICDTFEVVDWDLFGDDEGK